MLSDVVLERRLPERKVAELHRGHDVVEDESRSQTRPEPEKQHPPAVVASEGLHRRVVEDLRRLAERRLEVEPDPTGAEVHRLGDDAIVAHRRGNAHRDDVVCPVAGEIDGALHHLRRRQLGAGDEAPPLSRTG